MTLDLSDAIIEAQQAINDAGFEVTIKEQVQSGKSYSPNMSSVDHFTKAIQKTVRKTDPDGTYRGLTQTIVTIGAGGYMPKKDDLIELFGKIYGIMAVNEVAPTGEAVLYKLEIVE